MYKVVLQKMFSFQSDDEIWCKVISDPGRQVIIGEIATSRIRNIDVKMSYYSWSKIFEFEFEQKTCHITFIFNYVYQKTNWIAKRTVQTDTHF